MEVFKVTLFYTALLAFFGGRSYSEGCENDLFGKSADVRLRHDLLCSYNKNVRPVIDQSTQTKVNTVILFYTAQMDDEWDVLQMSIQLIMFWKDEFLVWDPSKYDNILNVFEESDKIWLPDIISYDTGYRDDNNEFPYFLPYGMVKINSSGIVRYNHRMTLNAHCTANLEKWPFDSHECYFFIGSPLYTNKYVNYSFPERYSDMNFYTPSREWYVDSITHKCLTMLSNHCIIQYKVKIVRYSSMYTSSVIIPAVVISLMRTFTFLMSGEKSLRIILLCLFFISELLYIEFLDTKIPNNGEHIVYIVLLYRNSLILTAMAIVINAISNGLYKRGIEDFPPNVPEWLKSTSTFLLNKRPITMLTNFNNQEAELLTEKNLEEDTQNSQRDKNAVFWKTLSILLDRICFAFTLVISLINFLFLIP